MAEVIVLDYHHPRVKLLGWLLEDSGMRVEEVDSVSRAMSLAQRSECRALIINSDESKTALTCLVRRLRAAHPHGCLAFVAPRRPFGALPSPSVPLDVTFDANDLVDQVRRICDKAA